MPLDHPPVLPPWSQARVLAALVLASLLCALLIGLRIVHSRQVGHGFLLFNLALAWLPVSAALAAYNLRRGRSRIGHVLVIGCAAVWLVFLPNAPYLVTDLIHLQPAPGVPFWYDVIMLSTFAWTGLFLGLVSLVAMQAVVRRTSGQAVSWLFVLAAILLTGYGIYVGRFLRWNSWDVVLNPWPLAATAMDYLRHPLAHYQATVFSLITAAVFGAMYVMLVAVVQFARESHNGAIDSLP